MTPDAPRGRGIALVGYRGTGKSTVGRLLADRLGRPFADLDREVEALADRPIRLIFAEDGEAAFRDLESRALLDLADRLVGGVLATGGGAILREANRRVLRDFGFVAWLRADAETLVRRLQASRRGVEGPTGLDLGRNPGRGRLGPRSPDPLYRESADLAVETGGRTAEQVADLVLGAWLLRCPLDPATNQVIR